MSAQLDHVYRYPFASHMEAGWGIHLATCGTAHDEQANPYFFEGRLEYPEEMAQMLLLLSEAVRRRFFLPTAARALDPVVTCSDRMVRFEGFSSCCGVYVRVDASGRAFEHGLRGRGTTNVDFNSGMRASLGSIRPSDEVRLAVGAEEVKLTRAASSTVEKKVKLPVRWLKGFTEVQAYQARLRRRFEIDGLMLRRFLRTLPKGSGPKQPVHAVPAARGLRVTPRAMKNSVPLAGPERLAMIEPFLRSEHQVHVWAEEQSGVSGWEILGKAAKVLILLSPEVSRGFSGEGQELAQLATKEGDAVLSRVRAHLQWQTELDPHALARSLDCNVSEIVGALAILASRGLVGFDLSRGAYFHRELPFDLDKVAELQPRLKAANKLAEAGKVRWTSPTEAVVQGSGVEYVVRLTEAGDRCTCPWYAKYQGQRGPCKHILAARILSDADV